MNASRQNRRAPRRTAASIGARRRTGGGEVGPSRSGSEPERELGVFAHPLWCPRRREGHRRLDVLDSVELADELLDLLGHLRADGTAGAGQRVGDADGAALDLDVVDQPQFDEVEPELRVDHIAQRLGDVFNRCHNELQFRQCPDEALLGPTGKPCEDHAGFARFPASSNLINTPQRSYAVATKIAQPRVCAGAPWPGPSKPAAM